ncbi:MAG: hypothetical protein H0T84_08800 [Tatlockia sp.]|nr:hypothetical protein [Tatlockia sp.]
MLTKSDLSKPPNLNWEIKEENDLDLCIGFLSNNDFTSCALHFTSNTLADNKLIQLQQVLISQKLTTLSLTANVSMNSAEQIATLMGSVIESLQDSLVSLTFRGLFAENTSRILADLIKNTSNLALFSVGAFYKGQSYYGTRIDEITLIAEALRANRTLSTLDLHSNMLLFEGALIIANALTGNKQLQKIDLRDNFIFLNEQTEILELLKSNQNLTEIYLEKTIISPLRFERSISFQQEFEQVLDCLSKSPNLSHIRLELRQVNDWLTEDLEVQFIIIIMHLKDLQSLQLFGFNREFFKVFSPFIRSHPTLEHLTFRHDDNLDVKSIKSIAALIKYNSNLRSISLGSWGAEIRWLPSTRIFKALAKNTSLTHVDLSKNTFYFEKGVVANIATMLKTNKSLKSLKLTNLFRTDKKAVQNILAALAENQTLLSLHLDNNNSHVNKVVISALLLNTSLTCLHLLNYPGPGLPEYQDDLGNLTAYAYENDIPVQILSKIDQIIKRNIEFKIWSLYRNYLLINSIELPADLQKFIFGLMIAKKFGLEELRDLSTTSSFKNADYLNPSVVEDLEGNKLDNFKAIYKALYEGQSSCFKSWNSMVNKRDLTHSDIEQYIRENPESRTAKAWQLADNYTNEQDYKKLFQKVHQYSFAHSSNVFGLFKRKQNFSEGYNNFETTIKSAAHGSRTSTITDIFSASSIEPSWL